MFNVLRLSLLVLFAAAVVLFAVWGCIWQAETTPTTVVVGFSIPVLYVVAGVALDAVEGACLCHARGKLWYPQAVKQAQASRARQRLLRRATVDRTGQL